MLHYTRYVFYQAFASYKSVCNAKMLVLLWLFSAHCLRYTLLRQRDRGREREREKELMCVSAKTEESGVFTVSRTGQNNDTSSGGIDVKEHDDKTNKNNKKLI